MLEGRNLAVHGAVLHLSWEMLAIEINMICCSQVKGKKKKPRMSMAVYWQCGVCGLFYLLVCSGVAALCMSTVENWVERALYSLVLEVNFMTWTFLMTWTFYR